MRLLGVELRRLFARRAVVVLMLLGTLAVACVAAGVLYNNRPVSAADVAQAQQEADRQNQDSYIQRSLDRCVQRSGDQLRCEDRFLAKPEYFLYRPQLRLADYRLWLVPMVAICAALALLVGATFVGGDFSSGSLGTQLLFQSNRWKLWAAKSAAVTLGAAVFTTVALTIANGAIWLFARSWDRPIPDGLLGHAPTAGGRGVVFSAAAGLGGFALVLIARHTAAALGLIALYGIAAEAVLRAVWPGSEHWLVSNHVVAFVGGTFKRVVYGSCDERGRCKDVIYRFTTGYSAVYLGLMLLVVLAASLVVFRRRDVA